MAICENCIHYELCSSISLKKIGISLIPQDECCGYKDRSRFVELPIKPGEKIYYFDTVGRIYETTVTQLVYGASGFLIDSDVMFNSNLIGKRFFLTREKAEQALKERENNAN